MSGAEKRDNGEEIPRDLLQRFMSKKQKSSVEAGEVEIELDLGLSLNGRFGVDPLAKTRLLTRSSSIPDLVVNGGRTELSRTCSLPVETEEWRKRKELQSLRRLEAKRKRLEKQRNVRVLREKHKAGGGGGEEGSIGSSGSGSSGLSELDTSPSPPVQGYSEAAKDPEMQGIYSNASSLNARPSNSSTMNQNMNVSRPRKRKDSTFLQSPWHKVYLQPSKLCHSISVSEQEWALAANTLCEKIDPNEVVSPSKKRLVLSTNLMQQLLQPAPTFVFSDIKSAFNYEIMLYFESRITLADACSVTCHSDFDKSTNDQERGYTALVKAFMEKFQHLEEDFQSSESATSMLDIILEIQDIERFSVINRLAKFHSRAKTNTKRSVPQRYVDLQKPGNLPEPLQCLSL